MKKTFILFLIPCVITLFLLFLPIPSLPLYILYGVVWILSFLMLIGVIKFGVGFRTFPHKMLFLSLFNLMVEISFSRLIVISDNTFLDRLSAINVSSIANILLSVAVLALMIIFITMESKKVSKSAARFALDYIPQRFFAIAQNAGSGLITKEEAEKQRANVRGQIDYSSRLDGCAKLLSRSAMATAVMYLISMIDGCFIHMYQKGFSASSAVKTVSFATLVNTLLCAVPVILMGVCVSIIQKKINKENEV